MSATITSTDFFSEEKRRLNIEFVPYSKATPDWDRKSAYRENLRSDFAARVRGLISLEYMQDARTGDTYLVHPDGRFLPAFMATNRVDLSPNVYAKIDRVDEWGDVVGYIQHVREMFNLLSGIYAEGNLTRSGLRAAGLI